MVYYLIWMPTIGFFISQNFYFKWNSYPQSKAELLADGIGYCLFLLSLIATLIQRKFQ